MWGYNSRCTPPTPPPEGLTGSPAGGNLHRAQVVRGLVGGGADEVEVEAVVGQLQQLHEQPMLALIIQVKVLPRGLGRRRGTGETGRPAANQNRRYSAEDLRARNKPDLGSARAAERGDPHLFEKVA